MSGRAFLSTLGAACLAVLFDAVFCPTVSMAHKLSPRGTAIERSVATKYSGWFQRIVLWGADRGITQFTEAVHEEITQRIFGCQGDADLCGNPDINFASPYVLAGVRWNDDPPFQLQSGEAKGTACKISETIRFTTQPQCWYQLFRDAEGKSARKPLNAESRVSLLARSHFGDLQFLHAMASKDGEPASDTKQRIMMWAEFTWRVSRGEFGLETKLKDVNVDGFSQFFGSSGWRVQELFALGNPVLRQWVKQVAFGSLLHMVEDSFARGHADREGFGEACLGVPEHMGAGRIKEFHSYLNQDHSRHGTYDSRRAFASHWETARPTVIDVGQALREYYDRNPIPTWEAVKPYVECVFLLENADSPASAGEGFHRDK